jgi:hypothetical protein
MGDEREVLTARGRAGGAQAELQNAILGTRANKERLDLAEKVLLERRKILPQGLELARLERLAAGPFASMNAKRARAIRAAAQRGREPSSSDLRFLQTFEAAAGTLQLVRGMDEALAEIPAERAALGRELSRLASLPPPISPDEAEVLTRSAIESRRGEEREKLRKDRQGDQRTRLRQQLGDAERQVNALAEMEGIDPGDLEDPQDAADYFALVRRVEEREGLDLESLRRRLKYVEREIDVDLGLAPPADLGGGDELLGQLRERYPGVSDDELREALR